MRKLILRNFQSPGDIVMLTAAVRDLHLSYPGQFLTDVRTSCPDLWENNPYITPLEEDDPYTEVIECQYPLIHKSNSGAWHFIHGFIAFLSERLGLDIKPTIFKGDIHLGRAEMEWMSQVQEITKENIPFWIVVAGGKSDYTIKWWALDRFQAVIDHFRDKVLFVQVGEETHNHPPLYGALDFRGKTDVRQLVRLVHHSQGILCPVTFLMHLAAAVQTRSGTPKNRSCVVVAGGREPSQWEAYPNHQFIHTNGALMCCDDGGCWKSRTVPLNDGEENDDPNCLCVDAVFGRQASNLNSNKLPKNALAYPVSEWPHLLPRCMDMITFEDVVRRIELYFQGGALNYLSTEHINVVRSLVRTAD